MIENLLMYGKRSITGRCAYLPVVLVFTYLCNLPLNASAKPFFRVLIGLNINYMESAL